MNGRLLSFLLLLCFYSATLKAQLRNDTAKTLMSNPDFRTFKKNDPNNCLFNIKPVIDIPVTALGIAGTVIGNILITKKSDSDSAQIANLNVNQVEFPWDRAATHNYSKSAGDVSNYFLFGGFVYGFTLLLDKDIRKDAGKIILMYLETMSLAGASYEMAGGLAYKYRPYAYNKDFTYVDGQPVPEVSFGERTSHFARNSFYSGHVMVPAASTMFVASVYSTYHPHSSFRFVLYGVAVAATGTTAYLRYKGGFHFPTDIVLGAALGTTYGLMVPKVHRCKNGGGLTAVPVTGSVNGVLLNYTF